MRVPILRHEIHAVVRHAMYLLALCAGLWVNSRFITKICSYSMDGSRI
jgi:hypothetical protein